MQANTRGKNVALSGLVLQAILSALAAGMWFDTHSPSSWAALWIILAPLPMWLLTLVLFYCRFLDRRESQELNELIARGGDKASIFLQGDQAQIRVAAGRLAWMDKYLAPAFTLLLAAYDLGIGLWILKNPPGSLVGPPIASATVWLFVSVGVAFAAFLFSRYVTGMAKAEQWRILRAPGSFLFTNALVWLMMTAVMVGEYYRWRAIDKIALYVLPAFMVVLGLELVLNFVLDIYRPRLPGAERRYSHDSRVLSLIASPESIGHSIAEALNYQFGFQVSSTWFYKLLHRAFVPLVLIAGIVLWALSSVVVVDEGQEYIVLRWGQPHPRQVLTPRSSPYLILPWPIEQALKFDTGKVHEMMLGVGNAVPGRVDKRVYLWTEDHGPLEELNTLVAVPDRQTPSSQPAGSAGETKVPSVNIIKLVAAVSYRITDPDQFEFGVTDTPKLLEDLAYREMIQYAASATLDEPLTGGEANRPQGIMSFGRGQFEQDLASRINNTIKPLGDGKGLGVEIVRVQLLASHPPKDAAAAFEQVAANERQRDQTRYMAQSEANKSLAEVAGDPDLAWKLAQAITIRMDCRRLQGMRQEGQDCALCLTNALATAKYESARLSAEIENERLRGKINDKTHTINQQLLVNQVQHVALLEGLQKDLQDNRINEAAAKSEADVELLFAMAQGKAAVEVAQARADRWQMEFKERSSVKSFLVQLLNEHAAPHLYRLEKYLDVLTEGLRDHRKYVLGVDPNKVEVRMNLERPIQAMSDIQPGPETKK